jgi:hypothetical protein
LLLAGRDVFGGCLWLEGQWFVLQHALDGLSHPALVAGPKADPYAADDRALIDDQCRRVAEPREFGRLREREC